MTTAQLQHLFKVTAFETALFSGPFRAPFKAPFKVPRPGPIWGDYPQRAERADGKDGAPRRRQPGLDAQRVADRADRLLKNLAWPSGAQPAQQISLRLLRHGWDERAVAAALALAARAMAAKIGWSPEPTQLLCAAHLLNGRLAQMDTGEGKTCSAALAAAVAALAGTPVHVLTANDYLAGRDLQRLAPMFTALGLTAAVARETDPPDDRRSAYQAQIVYATARCVAFDYLRDRQNLAMAADHRLDDGVMTAEAVVEGTQTACAPLLRGLCMAIIDEADSILIDEAKVPLILAESRVDPGTRARVWRAMDLAGQLTEGEDFQGGEGRDVGSRLTGAGSRKIAARSADYGGLWRHPLHRTEMVEQALHAVHGLRRDVDYLVREDKVVIVDAVSGRPAAERSWARDLHALVALKERLPAPEETVTRASITYPRLIGRYHHVGGLSGTLTDARGELQRQYGLSVATVPRARALRRRQLPMRLFADRSSQFDAAVTRACELAAAGRAVLLVTDSVDDNQDLADRSRRAGLDVAVLSALDDAAEADTIAAAGFPGKVTVATQMAGRGTDIALAPRVLAEGGLHIVNLQHNRSRRVDRQVAGRAGRRGDPGTVEHWVRVKDSPLAAARGEVWFWPLAMLATLCAEAPGRAKVTRQGEPLMRMLGLQLWRSGLARVLLAGFQWWCALDDRSQRARLVKADRDWSRALHFAEDK